MKRFISLLLSVLLVATMAVPSFANEGTGSMTVTLTRSEPEKTAFEKNGTFTVTVSVDCNNDTIKSGRVLTDFPDTLELTEVVFSDGIKLDDNIKSKDANKDTKDAIFASDVAKKFEGEICTFTFKVVKGSASSSTVSFDVKYLDGTTVDGSGTAIPVATDTKTLSVSTSCGTAHNYGTEIAEVPARCGVAGTEAHYQCDDCGKLFTEENETYNEVAAENLVIDALEHNFTGEWQKDATSHWKTCGNNCGAEDSKGDHGFELVIGDDTNGVETGKHAQKCSVCDYITEAVGHTCDVDYMTPCEDGIHHAPTCECGYVNEAAKSEHTLTWVIGDGNNGVATGKHAKKCSGCDYITEAVDHNFVYSSEKSNATNHVFVCVCGAEKSEVHTPEEAWSTDDNFHWHACTTEGCQYKIGYEEHKSDNVTDCSIASYCTDCGRVLRAAGEHDLEQKRQLIKATCTTNGEAAYWQCKNTACGKYFSDAEGKNEIEDLTTWLQGDGVIEAHGHHLVKQSEQPATCLRDGYNEHYKCTGSGNDICCTCGEYFVKTGENTYVLIGTEGSESDLTTWKATEGQGKIDQLSHVAGEGDEYNFAKKDSTCEEAGYEAYFKCKNGCGKYYYTNDQSVVAIGDDAALAAWKAEDGDGYIEPLGHDYTDQEISYVWSENDTICTASVACNRNGCGHVETEMANAAYTMTTPANCTNAEKGKYDATFKNTTLFQAQTKVHDGKNPALGHNWSEEWEKNESEHWHKCLRTGCTEKTLLVAHNYTTYVGSTETQHTYKCVCGKTETVDHNHDGNGKNLKKDETGHWYVCSCGYEKLGFEAHTFDTNDCTKAGTCTECGYVRPAGTHSWGAPEQTKDPTCTTAGTNKYTCASCKATETRDDIPALGHIVSSDSKAATCTEAGYKTYYTCTRVDCTCEGKYYTDSALTVSIGDGTLDTWKDSTGAGYIAPLGHSFTLTSSKAATCDVNGEKVYTCDRCNETKTENIIAHHTYDANGVCTGCGATLGEGAVQAVETAVGEVESGTGENTATVNTPAMEILNAVAGNDMPADIVEKIADGATLTVTFEVKKKNENEAKIDVSVAESYEEKVKETSEKGKDNSKVEISAPIDIDLSMILKNQNEGQINEGDGKIHNFSKPIEIAVPVPEDIQDEVKAASGKVVEYFMLRIHGVGDNKEVKVLNAWIDKDGKYCFETDKLSTFVPMVVISDPEPEERPHSHGDTIVIGKRDNKEETKEVEENPNTGAPVPSFGIALVVLGAASIAVSKKRK